MPGYSGLESLWLKLALGEKGAGIFCFSLTKLQDVEHLVVTEIQQWTKQELCPIVVEEKLFQLSIWLPLIFEAAPGPLVYSKTVHFLVSVMRFLGLKMALLSWSFRWINRCGPLNPLDTGWKLEHIREGSLGWVKSDRLGLKCCGTLKLIQETVITNVK